MSIPKIQPFSILLFRLNCNLLIAMRELKASRDHLVQSQAAEAQKQQVD